MCTKLQITFDQASSVPAYVQIRDAIARLVDEETLWPVDSNGVVVYAGTFSKVVFPGLRIGWIVAPRRVIEHLADMVRAAALSCTVWSTTSLG